jgi:hypothetical protein
MRSFLIALLIIFIFSCKDDNNNKLGTITGNVSTLNGDTAISGARIVMNPASDTVFTDEKGNFTLSGIEPGNYTVIASKDGFTDGTVPAIVLENATATVIFRLSRLPIILTGQWQGKIRYYTTDYTLLLDISKVTLDSIYGTMIIDFTAGADTFPIHSELYFDNDSLHFDLSHTWGQCHAYDMWGLVVNKDSLRGNWKYRCSNDPVYTSPWSAKREVK